MRHRNLVLEVQLSVHSVCIDSLYKLCRKQTAKVNLYRANQISKQALLTPRSHGPREDKQSAEFQYLFTDMRVSGLEPYFDNIQGFFSIGDDVEEASNKEM